MLCSGFGVRFGVRIGVRIRVRVRVRVRCLGNTLMIRPSLLMAGIYKSYAQSGLRSSSRLGVWVSIRVRGTDLVQFGLGLRLGLGLGLGSVLGLRLGLGLWLELGLGLGIESFTSVALQWASQASSNQS